MLREKAKGDGRFSPPPHLSFAGGGEALGDAIGVHLQSEEFPQLNPSSELQLDLAKGDHLIIIIARLPS